MYSTYSFGSVRVGETVATFDDNNVARHSRCSDGILILPARWPPIYVNIAPNCRSKGSSRPLSTITPSLFSTLTL